VQIVRENLKTTKSRQKICADNRRRELIFEVGDFVYLKISPMRGMKDLRLKANYLPATSAHSKFWEKVK
jgi:hypothetical protein